MKQPISFPAPLPADANLDLILVLRDVSHILRQLYEGKGSQARILIVLGESGPITQRKLTELLGIQPGSASEVIAKLERAGLIHRSPSQHDRRTVDISLTEEGMRQSLEARQQRIRRHTEMFECLSDEEKQQLLLLLNKLGDDWAARYGDRAPEGV